MWFDISLLPGFQSTELIIRAGLDLGDVSQFPVIDVTIDGADECVLPISPFSVQSRPHTVVFDDNTDHFEQLPELTPVLIRSRVAGLVN